MVPSQDGETIQGITVKDLLKDLPNVFTNILNEVPASGQDLVRLHIRHDVLTKGDVKIRLQPCSQMTANTIMTRIEEVLQSHENLAIDDSFEVAVGVIHLPSGPGRAQVTNLHGEHNNFLLTKRSIVTIVNSDSLCLARAIAVGLGNLQFKSDQIRRSQYNQIKDHRCRNQKRAAFALHHQAGVPIDR